MNTVYIIPNRTDFLYLTVGIRYFPVFQIPTSVSVSFLYRYLFGIFDIPSYRPMTTTVRISGTFRYLQHVDFGKFRTRLMVRASWWCGYRCKQNSSWLLKLVPRLVLPDISLN